HHPRGWWGAFVVNRVLRSGHDDAADRQRAPGRRGGADALSERARVEAAEREGWISAVLVRGWARPSAVAVLDVRRRHLRPGPRRCDRDRTGPLAALALLAGTAIRRPRPRQRGLCPSAGGPSGVSRRVPGLQVDSSVACPVWGRWSPYSLACVPLTAAQSRPSRVVPGRPLTAIPTPWTAIDGKKIPVSKAA